MVSSTLKVFLIGMAAGVASLLVSALLRLFADGIFLPELASQTLFSLTPGRLESGAVETLGSLAKYSAFTSAIAVNLVVYGIVAILIQKYGWLRNQAKGLVGRFLTFALLSYVIILALAEIFLGVTQIASQPLSAIVVALYLLPPHIAFGAVAAPIQLGVSPPSGVICEPAAPSKGNYDRRRRLLIRGGVAAAVASVILFYGVDLLFAKPSAVPEAVNLSVLTSQEVTSNEKFYRVDVNIIPPDVDSSKWTLTVAGLVSSPLALTYEDLKSMSVVKQYNTLECVSNKVGGDLISTALWTGVRLKDLLQKAGMNSNASYVVFKCSDGYDVGIPLERGLLDGTLLAFEMNGVPLPKEHGFPVRAIVPGLYGMMNAKWITSIELVNEVYRGYWQRRGWANDAHYQTGSEIVIPGSGVATAVFGISGSSVVQLGQNLPIAGIAFAGDRGVSKVEVSTDGGKTWTAASFKDPLSQYTWVLWSASWNPPSTGSYSIAVRATDKTGAVQTAEISDSFPNGATGYHVVDIFVTSNK